MTTFRFGNKAIKIKVDVETEEASLMREASTDNLSFEEFQDHLTKVRNARSEKIENLISVFRLAFEQTANVELTISALNPLLDKTIELTRILGEKLSEGLWKRRKTNRSLEFLETKEERPGYKSVVDGLRNAVSPLGNPDQKSRYKKGFFVHSEHLGTFFYDLSYALLTIKDGTEDPSFLEELLRPLIEASGQIQKMKARKGYAMRKARSRRKDRSIEPHFWDIDRNRSAINRD